MGKISLTVLLVLLFTTAYCQQEKPLVLKGNELYKRQQYDKAAEEYKKAADLNEKDPAALYNLGNALYKGNKAEAAEKVYDHAADNAKDAASKEKSVYNKGVTLSRQNKLQESIDTYKQALRITPTDEEARQNLQKALNELKKQQQQPKQDKKKQDKDKNKQNPNNQPQNKSKLNQKQAEQMLNSLRQEEKKLQQGMQKKNNTGGANGKDW